MTANEYADGIKRGEGYATDWLSDESWPARAAIAKKLQAEPSFVLAAAVQGIISQCERNAALSQIAALVGSVVAA